MKLFYFVADLILLKVLYVSNSYFIGIENDTYSYDTKSYLLEVLFQDLSLAQLR